MLLSLRKNGLTSLFKEVRALKVLKAQLGEPFLEFLFFPAEPALKSTKPALKGQTRHLSAQTGTQKRAKRSKSLNWHLSAETGT